MPVARLPRSGREGRRDAVLVLVLVHLARSPSKAVNCRVPLRQNRVAGLWACWRHMETHSVVRQEFRIASLYDGLAIKWGR